MQLLLSLLACGLSGPPETAEEPEKNVVQEAPPKPRGPLRRPPTEIGHRNLDDERAHKKARKEWFEAFHRTAPGTDWRALERENGRAQIRKRNDLARGVQPLVDLGPGVWVERGSDNQAGRMHAATLTSDGSTIYAGSSLGGVWRGSAEGTAWEPIGDNLAGGAHHLVLIDDGRVIVTATNSGSIHRSTDQGATWDPPSGIPWLWGLKRLIAHEEDLFTVVTEPYGACSIYRSTNEGISFAKVLDFEVGCGDVWAPRTGEGPLYAVDGGRVMTSDDRGDSWSEVGNIGVDAETTELAGSEAGAPTLYAVTNADRVHRSDDAGASWTAVHDAIDYWSRLTASITDPELFAWGGVELHVTRDGGDSFEVQNAWWEYYDDPATLLHADMMGIEVQLDEDGEERWYISTDGGLYESRDRMASVNNLALQGLRVSQYYDVLTSVTKPEQIAAGSQDQGYQRTTVGDIDGPTPFDQLVSGDYGHLTSGDGTHKLIFSVYPGVMLVVAGLNDQAMYWPEFPAGETYAWLPPIVADPSDPESVFFCAGRLYRYNRVAEDWWEPVQWSDQSFSSDGYEYLSALAFSPIDPDLAWAATSYGRIFYSTDHARTWTESRTTGPWPHYFYGHAIEPSLVDPDIVYIGGSGYDGPAVLRSQNGGRRFDDWSVGLPPTHVYTLTEAPDGSGDLYAGTETAAYERKADAGAWIDITSNQSPVTIYWSSEALQEENTIRFGTYGRGIWDYQRDPLGVGCFPPYDGDGDGHDCDVDCDDTDPLVFPGADDPCDGIDQDCSGPDLDEDGDGFWACQDCDDANRSAHPEGTEVCGNEIDEDCDGEDTICAEDTEKKGCGCSSIASSGSTPWVWSVLMVGFLHRRRRSTLNSEEDPARKRSPEPEPCA